MARELTLGVVQKLRQVKITMRLKTLFACAILGLAALAVTPVEAQTIVNPATTDQEWEDLVASSPQQATFIRNLSDWDDFHAGARFQGHPLYDLTQQQLDDFENSLWIVDGSVQTMDIGIIRDNLSTADYEDTLAAFGIAPSLAEDHEDYWCESRANCKTQSTYICLSTC